MVKSLLSKQYNGCTIIPISFCNTKSSNHMTAGNEITKNSELSSVVSWFTHVPFVSFFTLFHHFSSSYVVILCMCMYALTILYQISYYLPNQILVFLIRQPLEGQYYPSYFRRISPSGVKMPCSHSVMLDNHIPSLPPY